MTPLGRGSRSIRTVEADVAVVGAGMAGLAAATELKRRGRVLRRAGGARPGGRPRAVAGVEPDRWIDVGGQWVGPTQDRLYALAREHGAATFPTWTAGQNVLEMGGRLVRYTRHDPAPSPARAGGRRPGDDAHRPDGGEGAARGALEVRRPKHGTARRPGRGCAATW